MTADTTDLEALHAALNGLHADLDARPDDQGARSVMADLYADLGDDGMTEGLRLMAAGDHHPTLTHGWAFREGYEPRDCFLPLHVFEALVGTETGGEEESTQDTWVARAKTYPTRRAAEEALCRALALT